MLITKEVEINITNRNRKYYKDKCYNCDNVDKIVVKIEDLNPNSHCMVEVICEGCNTPKEMDYEVYLRNINSTDIKEYYCIKCKSIKTKHYYQKLQDQGLLKRGDNYYWFFKENRLLELDKYIKKYKHIDNITVNDFKLYEALRNDNISELINELGYNVVDVYNNKPYGYFNDIEKIINEINKFIYTNNRFPTQNEMQNELGLYSLHIYKHFKSFNELKKYMNYNDENDLIDNRGDCNKSYYELYVANYLIAQGLNNKYKREQYPFKQFNNSLIYRSDFTFYLENDKQIHIEVWGDSENKKGNYYDYCKTRKIKENLYNSYKNNIILIEVEPNIFTGTYLEIEKSLYNIFKEYLPLQYKTVDYKLLLPLNALSEEELLQQLMYHSDNDNYLPKGTLLRVENISLLTHIDRKYGGLNYFAKKFNKKMYYRPNHWSKEKVFEALNYMLSKYDRFLSYRNDKNIYMNDEELYGLFAYINKHESYHYYKIRYCEYCLENNINIHECAIIHLNNVIIRINDKNYKNITNEDRLLAQEILNSLNNNKLKQVI